MGPFAPKRIYGGNSPQEISPRHSQGQGLTVHIYRGVCVPIGIIMYASSYGCTYIYKGGCNEKEKLLMIHVTTNNTDKDKDLQGKVHGMTHQL